MIVDPAFLRTRGGNLVELQQCGVAGTGVVQRHRRRARKPPQPHLSARAMRELAKLGQGSDFHLHWELRGTPVSLAAQGTRLPWDAPDSASEDKPPVAGRRLQSDPRMHYATGRLLPAQCCCGNNVVAVTSAQLLAGDVRCGPDCELPPRGTPLPDINSRGEIGVSTRLGRPSSGGISAALPARHCRCCGEVIAMTGKVGPAVRVLRRVPRLTTPFSAGYPRRHAGQR